MTRMLGALITAILVLCGLASSVQAAVSVPAGAAAIYTYDAPIYDAPGDDSVHERGPPTAPRPEVSSTRLTTTYAYPATLVQVARPTTTTGSQVRAAHGELSSLRRSGVAAKNVCKVNSFTSDTPVLMADGTTKAIEDVELGDWVLAEDPDTGERGPRQVIDLIRHGGRHTMVAIHLADGSTIEATDLHPFWVASRGRWVYAVDLQAGDVLDASDGSRAKVESIGVSREIITAYNLTVDDLHTYFAGSASVLVHNDGGDAYPIDLGGGYWGRMDRFPVGQGTDFEVHVVRGGSEVGVFGSNGWFPKHGLGTDVSVPDSVSNRLKGLSVNEMRASGRLGAKGTMDITGDKWMRPRLGGGC